MYNRRRTALATLTLAACATPLHALVAFPGAEGFGANATGGRGGDVYHVTTLIDDPNHLTPGSLAYGLYFKNVPAAGRTIVFDVGGTIHLGANTLDIKNISRVTIAGQTAPSPVTIVGNTVQITSSGGSETGNIIFQGLAVRKGLENSGDSLDVKGAGNTHDVIIDHVSATWGEDEVVSVAGATNHSENVTVQNSIISESLESGHQFGALIRNDQSEHVSYNRNLFSNNSSRNPRPGTYLNTTLDFEFQNNTIYNWSDRAGYTGGASESDTENVNMNYVGNYLIAGPSTVGGSTTAGSSPTQGARRNTAFTKDASNDPLDLHFYQSGNKIDWVAGPARDGQDIGWAAFDNWNGTTHSAFPTADQQPAPFAYPTLATADSADTAYAKLVAGVGAYAAARTTTDARLINELLTNTGASAITSPNSAEWNAILAAPTVTRPANFDTDGDGMPNSWEILRGYNPNAADNNTLTASGYTRLEKYLHSLMAVAAWNTDASAPWSDYLNWRGDRPNSTDASATFGPVLSAPRTITLDQSATLTSLTFDSTQKYTLAGPGTLTLQAIAGRSTLTVNSGSHTISAPLHVLSPAALTIAPGAQLDIATNTLLLSNPDGTSPLTTIRSYLQSHQLTSSNNDTTHTLGYRLNPDNTLTVLPTLQGDANLDGQLNADDYALLDRSLAVSRTNATWTDGDFNYDGVVNQNDYLLIDTAYAKAQGSFPGSLLAQRDAQFGDTYVSALLTSIPEPSLLLSSILYPLSSLLFPRRPRRPI